jgi:hypothetical protein
LASEVLCPGLLFIILNHFIQNSATAKGTSSLQLLAHSDTLQKAALPATCCNDENLIVSSRDVRKKGLSMNESENGKWKMLKKPFYFRAFVRTVTDAEIESVCKSLSQIFPSDI